MATPPTNIIDDYLDSFPGGVDTNQATRILPPTKLAAGFNLSLRGDFAATRPPFRFINIIDPAGVITALGGLYQGGCYYRPDSAPESLFVVVSGRLFQLTPDTSGNALLTERTIPGNPNSPNVPQAWLWQAENFLIVNDGINLPMIFDGSTSRRSLGNGVTVLATTIAPFTAPAVGAGVTANIAAPYNGPIGVVVQAGSDSYTVISAGTTSATAYNGTALQTSSNVPNGTTIGQFMKPSAFYAYLAVNKSVQANVNWPFYSPGHVGATPEWPPHQSHLPIPQNFIQSFTFTRPFTGPLYSVLYLNGKWGNTKVGVASISADRLTLGLVLLVAYAQNLQLGYTTANVIQGATNITWTNLTIPPLVNPGFSFTGAGNVMNFTGNTNYTGPIPDFVYIRAVAPPLTGTNPLVEFQLLTYTPSTTTTFTLTLANVNATPGTIYAPGTNITISANELPAGRMGTYGQGRIWMALTDGISFIGSDVVGSSSGTLQYNFRDAVLHVTQNVTLAGGVNFRIPSSDDTIRAMRFTNTLDVSLGQGPLMVFTDKSVFSCQAPVDQTTWASLTNPILTEALKGQGGKSQNAVVLSNADIIFRSNAFNIRSLLLARMDYNQWGNTPISTEMIRFLKNDDPSLLVFASGIQFDNRMFMTVFPVQGQTGVFHLGMVALNFDSISTLQGKQPSIWEGLWTGLQINQLFSGSFQNVERAFAFVFDTPCTTGQLFELLPETTSQIYDVSDFGPSAPVWGFETRDLFRGKDNVDSREFKALEDGAIAVDDVLGLVTFQVFYKSDQSPNWYLWRQFSKHVDETLPNAQPGYFPQLGLGRPDELTSNDGFSDRNSRFGYTFQLRVIITGHCRFIGAHLAASRQPEPEFPTPSS